MLRTAIELVAVKPVTFDAARPASQANAVTLSSGKRCFITHDGVVVGVTEQEFLESLPSNPA